MSAPEPHVIVVGGGPVGLSAALLLDRAGIRTTVLERDTTPSTHPKARGIRTRTMELFTRWGLGSDLAADGLPAETNRFIYCDSLAGREIARSPEPEADDGDITPCGPLRVSQDAVHRVLLQHVRTRPHVTIHSGEEVTGIVQSDEHVEVRTAGGASYTADYIIAADGVGSTIRNLLQIQMEGDACLGYGQSIYWHGELDEWVKDRLCIQFITGHRRGRPANIAPVDGRRRWVTMIMQPGGTNRPLQPTPAEAAEVIRDAVGADVTVEVIDIATWRISAQVAARWRDGRVFLAGDAAHSFPPTGGFGMNTGVQDVHNLVWKLAMVLEGSAGARLLDTYEDERIAVARSNAAWSVVNGNRMRDIGRAIATDDADKLAELLDEQRSHIHANEQDLGFRYERGALIENRSVVGSPLRVANVGHRFPETAVMVDGTTSSSVLGLPDRFALVTSNPSRWYGSEVLVAPCGPQVLGGRTAALVRPDGIVAWLADEADGPETLHQVLGQLVGPCT